MKYPARERFWWLTVGGIGFMRPASGTWGSMPPVVLAGVLFAAGLGPGSSPWIFNGILLGAACVFSLACVFQGDRAEVVYGKDPSVVVADEVAGQSVTLLFLPAAAVSTPVQWASTLVIGFLAFRVLDIIKPWPARQIQSLPGGWGILTDDLFAGIYAMGLVQLWTRLGPFASSAMG